MIRLPACISALILFLCLTTACGADTAGINTPGSVAELKSVEIGGMNQWILMRGEDRNNPVLLWLHGGPGAAQMPVHYTFTRDLEKAFIVVHWDQRGAGKSNHREFRKESMSIDRFTEDAHELTQYLKERFNTDKIILLGHSWGTQFGLITADRYPDDYAAFISVGQVVNPVRATSISYEWLKNEVAQHGSRRQKRAFAGLGEPPFPEHRRYVPLARMTDRFGGGMDLPMSRLFRISTGAREYTPGDYLKWLRGANRGSGPMWEETSRMNMSERVTDLEVPVWFIVGENDYNTPAELVREYYEGLNAPHKEIIVMENAAHTPFFKDPDRFNEMIITIGRSLPEMSAGR
jgi:pimeloyl-ACP methyl ester carboxylesterase